MIGTIFLYFVCFEFSHLLFHLLMESILLPCCVSEGDHWVLGCRCFPFFKAVFASESASSEMDYEMSWGVYKSDVLYFWTGAHEVLMNCFYSGVVIVFSVLRYYS